MRDTSDDLPIKKATAKITMKTAIKKPISEENNPPTLGNLDNIELIHTF